MSLFVVIEMCEVREVVVVAFSIFSFSPLD